MNIKRAFLVLMALMMAPALAWAGLPVVVSPAAGTAVIIVQKAFTDFNNESEVTLMMQCLSGNPTQQEVTLTPISGQGSFLGPYEAAFVLENIPGTGPDGEPGQPGSGTTCTIVETAVDGVATADSGYNDTYTCWADGRSDDSMFDPNVQDYPDCYTWPPFRSEATECEFTDVKAGDIGRCLVRNEPKPVEVTVVKEWVVEGDEGQTVDPITDIVIRCDNFAEIVGVNDDTSADYSGTSKDDDSSSKASADFRRGDRITFFDVSFDDRSDATLVIDVIPGYPDSNCGAIETIRNSAVELDSTCGSFGRRGGGPPRGAGIGGPGRGDLPMEISVADGGDSCLMVNTVFYEGIPTLSQYGLAIMALLMLGVGFVGFRRFV